MRIRTLAFMSLVLIPGAARAQCPGSTQVGHLGIASIECDCVIAPPTRSTQWRFQSEPRIRRIEPRSPAYGRLQEGDVIVAVNGYAITTERGADLLARPPINRELVLRVRRDGRTQQVTLRPASVCPNDTRVLGATAPVSPPSSRGTPAPAAAVGATPRVAAPTAWVGIAFSCRDCSYERRDDVGVWSFRTSPEVYSVEPGSPAHVAGIRRGDVITHVDDQPITGAAGGRRWASLKPGDQVRVRYRRGTAVNAATMRVSPPRHVTQVAPAAAAREWIEMQATIAQRDSSTQRLFQQYEQTLRVQQAMHERLVRQLRESGASNAVQQRAYREQQEALRQHEQQLEALVRARQIETQRDEALHRNLEALLATARLNTSAAPAPTPGAAAQRYSGTFAGVDIEVRGGNPVIVSEGGEELVIRMADGSTVRLRRTR